MRRGAFAPPSVQRLAAMRRDQLHRCGVVVIVAVFMLLGLAMHGLAS
ncbi:MAG TPA: hypothetical protein VMU55_05170 [Solirubrobacteraceae bacterium]|nr:hypothetical protein [Solirubrobacteraceae bacterium]